MAAINLNVLAQKIAQSEGKKVSLPIGQIKEVMRIMGRELANLDVMDLADTLKKYRVSSSNKVMRGGERK